MTYTNETVESDIDKCLRDFEFAIRDASIKFDDSFKGILSGISESTHALHEKETKLVLLIALHRANLSLQKALNKVNSDDIPISINNLGDT